MNGRGFYVSYGFGEPQEISRAQRNPDSRSAQEARAREEFMRQQQIRQRQQRQQREAERKQESSGGGFGYFLAALVGVAAGFIAKAFLGDPEEEKPRQETRGYNREVMQNTAAQYEPTGNPDEVGDPADSQLEECNDIVCPITLEVMSDPVISKRCGHSFEGHAIVTWCKSKDFCPKCHAPLHRTDLVKNFSLKNAIDYMRKQAKDKK